MSRYNRPQSRTGFRSIYQTARNLYGGYKMIRNASNAVQSTYKSLARRYGSKNTASVSQPNRQKTTTPKSKQIRRNINKKKYNRLSKDAKQDLKLTKLNKELSSLKSKVAGGQGHLHYLERWCGRIACNAQQAGYFNGSGLSMSMIERGLAYLKFYDPANPGTYITSNLTSGLQSKSVMYKFYSKFQIRNNYAIPVNVRVYIVSPKDDTNTQPITACINGYQDVGITNPTSNILAYPYMSSEFNELYKIQSLTKVELQPGTTKDLFYSDKKKHKYDPSYFDDQKDEYQGKFGCHLYMVRVEGVLGHDTNPIVNQCAGAIDMMITNHIEYFYDAGVNVKYFQMVDNSTAFNTTVYTDNKPSVSHNVYTI